MKKRQNHSNWAELPPELTSLILLRLSMIEILHVAQKVCSSWRRVCKDPSMWTKIDTTRVPENFEAWRFELEDMCLHAVDLSRGGLLEINIKNFGSSSLLSYIADRSSNLRRLGVVDCGEVTSHGIFKAVVKLPLLEELEISSDSIISGWDLKAVSQSCPNMRTLMIRRLKLKVTDYLVQSGDDIASAIANTMPRLRHLQLLGNGLSDAGLNVILDNCQNLEHLDIRRCFNVYLLGGLKKQRFKVFRHPDDSIYEYDAVISDTEEK